MVQWNGMMALQILVLSTCYLKSVLCSEQRAGYFGHRANSPYDGAADRMDAVSKSSAPYR